MTTSYKLKAIEELRAQKKLERELEENAIEKDRLQKEADHKTNQDRIARKMHKLAQEQIPPEVTRQMNQLQIATGEDLPMPEPKVETPKVEKPKPIVKEKKDATTKRQKPKNSKQQHKKAKKRGPKPKASGSNSA